MMKLETTHRLLDAIWAGLIASLIALPLVIMLTRWRGLALYIGIVVLGVLVLLLWQARNYWAWRRELREMKRDADFTCWLDRVEGVLRQYGEESLKHRSEDDWLVDFEAGMTPKAAALASLKGIRELR